MDFLTVIVLTKPLWLWLVFAGTFGALLWLDLGVWHRGVKEISVRDSLISSAFFIGAGLLFSAVIWGGLGAVSAGEYLNGYIVEQTLSMDNIFVISVIFAFLGIPRAHQHRVLFWGILGAFVLRGLMIGAGAALVTNFGWVLYVFAAFLLFTGVKMLFLKDSSPSIETSPILKFLRGHFKITPQLHGQKFLVYLPFQALPAAAGDSSGAMPAGNKSSSKLVLYITPLFVALIMIEFADVIFAVDSVPAIFAITTDPYVVFTSNLFAILGLRSLFFSLSAMVERFKYLKVALAWVLIFIGGKVLAAPLLGIEKVPSGLSLGVTVAILAWGVGYSMWKTRGPKI